MTPTHPNRAKDPKPRPRASRKDVDKLLQECWDLGADIKPSRKNHFLVLPPDGKERAIDIPGTPSSSRTLMNKRKQLQRHGVPVKTK